MCCLDHGFDGHDHMANVDCGWYLGMDLTSITIACTGLIVTVQTRSPNMGSGNSLHGDYAWMSIVEFTDNFPVEVSAELSPGYPKAGSLHQ